jgi:hypothetical protein
MADEKIFETERLDRLERHLRRLDAVSDVLLDELAIARRLAAERDTADEFNAFRRRRQKNRDPR